MLKAPLFCLATPYQFILASNSPRRQQFLADWGIPFTVLACIDEPDPFEGESPTTFTKRSAKYKADYAKQQSATTSIILAADTVVAQDGKILGKPANEQEALDMLRNLNGRKHTVTTSMHLYWPIDVSTESLSITDECTVFFRKFTDSILSAYVRTKEPWDKAGAYAIQGQGAFLVERIEGCWATVVGLPLPLLADELLQRKLLLPCTLS
ncbi:MAG: septum formation protein Maf [Desulfovibrio sp.]|nr:septum formation protein Maf [Desulfovibrio sp.]